MNEKSNHSVIDSDVLFKVNAFTRAITTDKSQKTVIMQGDHNSERFTFEIPRYIEGHDMYLCNSVQVYFLNIENNKKGDNKHCTGVHTITDLHLSPDDDNVLICSWLVSMNATNYAGILNFMLRLSCMNDETVEYRWNTDIFSDIYVVKGLNGDLSFEAEYVDIIEQWKVSLKTELTDYIESNVQRRVLECQETIDGNLKTYISEVNDNLNASVEEVREQVTNSVNALDGILQKEIGDMNQELNVQKARMDTFTSLPEGSTTGDAELADIRVGADGTIYKTAGEAIRTLYMASNVLTIESHNYKTCLPDANITGPSICRLNFAYGDTDIPANLPFTKWPGGIATLITSNGERSSSNPFSYTTQILFTNENIYYRYYGTDYGNWCDFNDVFNSKVDHETTITSSNYAELLPDVNTVTKGIWRLNFAHGDTDIPANLPFTKWHGGVGTLICITHGNGTYSTQILITGHGLYYRYKGSDFYPWNTLADSSDSFVTVSNGDSILEGVKRCYLENVKTLRVEAGNYDIIAEYEAHYGSDYFTNYTGYSGSDDKFDRGIWLEDIEVVFSPGAKVVAFYTGDNDIVVRDFSPFATGNNVTIDGLVLESSNLRYGLHCDFNTGSDRSFMIIRNCDLSHNSIGSNVQSMGCGFGVHVDWLIENTIFRSSLARHVVRIHNNISSESQSKAVFRNCYIEGDGYFLFNSYSESEHISNIMVTGCSFKTPPKEGFENDGSTIKNINMIAFNNEIRTV